MDAEQERGATYREVFASGEFRALFGGYALSVVGDQVARVAVALLVYDDSKSPLLTALSLAISYLPWLVGGPLLSSLADRLPRRRILVVTDLLRAGLLALLAVSGLPLAVTLLLLLAVAMLAPPFESARAALLPDVLPGDRYVVGNVALNLLFQTGQVLGFALGGALVEAITVRGTLLLDAATFLVSAVLVRLWVRERPVAAADRAGRRSLWRDSREGLAVVFGMPVLRSLILLSWVGAGFAIAPEALAVPYAEGHGGGPVASGLLTAALPLGTVVGGVLLARLVAPRRRLRLMLPLALLSFVPLLATGFTPSVPVVWVLWVLAGTLTCYHLPANASFVEVVPPKVRARAFGLAQSGLQAVQGLAVTAAGALAEIVDPGTVVAASAAVGLLVTAGLALTWPADVSGAAPSVGAPPAR